MVMIHIQWIVKGEEAHCGYDRPMLSLSPLMPILLIRIDGVTKPCLLQYEVGPTDQTTERIGRGKCRLFFNQCQGRPCQRKIIPGCLTWSSIRRFSILLENLAYPDAALLQSRMEPVLQGKGCPGYLTLPVDDMTRFVDTAMSFS